MPPKERKTTDELHFQLKYLIVKSSSNPIVKRWKKTQRAVASYFLSPSLSAGGLEISSGQGGRGGTGPLLTSMVVAGLQRGQEGCSTSLKDARGLLLPGAGLDPPRRGEETDPPDPQQTRAAPDSFQPPFFASNLDVIIFRF